MIVKRHNRNIIDGKEIVLTIQDALFSTESMRFMLGGAIRRSGADTPVTVRLNAQGVLGDNGAVPTLYDYVDGATELTLPESYKFINMTKGVRGQVSADKSWDTVKTGFEKGDIVRFFWEKEVKNKEDAAVEITISPNTFPGTLRQNGSAPRGELKRITNQIGELLETA